MVEDDHLFKSLLQTDGFDRLPDELILLIFNKVSDIKTLTRCRTVSKRFNSLVPQADNLFVKVDCILSSDSGDSFLVNVLKSVLQSLKDFISPESVGAPLPRTRSSPAEILRGFKKIKRLELELPAGDLRLEKGTVLKWKAEFGRTLKSCVIVAVRGDGQDEEEIDFSNENGEGGMKLRVVWTISALIAASARHYLLRDVIREHGEIESLVLSDREGEGMVVMGKEGLKEFRDVGEEEEEGEEERVSVAGWRNRTTVPAVRMRMRHVPNVDVGGGVRVKGATLVVLRSKEETETKKRTKREAEEEEDAEDKRLALGTFGGVLDDAMVALFKQPSYLLEMNSF